MAPQASEKGRETGAAADGNDAERLEGSFCIPILVLGGG
jgi:hypothetical protein